MSEMALGLDSGTQGVTTVVADVETRRVVWQKSLDYRTDPRLKNFGLNDAYILPPREEGEANQPALMYFASLDAIFEDMAREFPHVGDIAVVNVSAQQHGHVLLHKDAEKLFAGLRKASRDNLTTLLDGAFSLPFARIWRTSCTGKEAEFVRSAVGGKEKLIRLSGSDAPLRFSAFGIMKTAREFPREYRSTILIHQISSLLPAVLAGAVSVPLDFGNACGTSLMDYRAKKWSPELISAASDGLSGGAEELRNKLPRLESGASLVGRVAEYFVKKYGFNPECRIGIGSGDNPQTKVLVEGSLLSLGTSFVIMARSDGRSFDMEGHANAMYDALDRPFVFGCRTNGALRWDDVRAEYGMGKGDFAAAEAALRETPAGNRGRIFLWQAEKESFPLSGVFGPARTGYKERDFAADYAGIVESTLASVYLHSRRFTTPEETLYVAGGAAKSAEALRRVAAIWKRRVIPVEEGGAALGAAASGAYALLLSRGGRPGDEFCPSFLRRRDAIEPREADVAAYHEADGYLEKFAASESALIARR